MKRRIRATLVGTACAWAFVCGASLTQAQAATDFTVPAEPLAEALRAIASQTNTNILFDQQAVAGRSAKAIKARLSLDEALREVLSGTALTYRKSDERTIIIVPLAPAGAMAPDSTLRAPLEALAADPQGRSWLHLAAAEIVSAVPRRASDFPAPAPQSGSTAEGSQVSLQEIVVTAQKRSEDVQSVPISIQVVSAQVIASQNHNSFEELSQTLPGINIASSGWADSMYIRGVGSGVNSTNFDQSVAIFEDDVYHGRSKTSGATFSISIASRCSKGRRRPSSATTRLRAPSTSSPRSRAIASMPPRDCSMACTVSTRRKGQ